MTLVDKIRELANQRNMSLPDLEIKVGLGNGTISRWKSSSPNTDKLTKVADELGVSVDYLLGREPEQLNNVYFSLAKEAEQNGIDPEDIRLALDTIRRLRGDKK